MSDSRLEKFVYAICSMDVSDLPVPLSRIEKLWNCLITGETPDFEPLSRNEKYLMAMLDRYDISNLPAPMSRGEKLLYKIAVGETDLSDVPGYLSRYEELLTYLIENGGISGGDFEYVLYTLNQSLSTLYTTAEKPVKSAILKGQTLMNHFPPFNPTCWEARNGSVMYDGYVILKANNAADFRPKSGYRNYPTLKPSTQYTYIYYVSENVGNVSIGAANGFPFSGSHTGLRVGLHKSLVTTPEEIQGNYISQWFVINADDRENGYAKITMMMLIEGDWTNTELPFKEHFDGMQSVQMPVLTTTGKNFSLVSSNVFMPTSTSTWYFANGLKQTLFGSKLKRNSDCEWFYLPDGVYTFSYGNGTSRGFQLIAEYEKYSYNINNNTSRTIKEGWYTVRIKSSSENLVDIELVNLQIEKGSVATPYEPYKTNILTVNEDVTLRGIGDVNDELDCLTGEVTERIEEIVLDGSEDWIAEDARFRLYRDDIVPNKWTNGLSNYFIGNRGQLITGVDYDNYFAINGFGSCLLVRDINLFPNPKSQLNEFKTWLRERNAQGNPVILQYILATESIKTVDLTTVDQDGQPTKLKTFNDITYVEINAESIIPSVDVEVATKISETLSTMEPQQLDISETQNKLGQTIDEQTENTDATMMATTEIYEQTL